MTRSDGGTEQTLVSCEHCGVVFELEKVPTIRCPVCEGSGPRQPVPKVGRVNKWWSKV